MGLYVFRLLVALATFGVGLGASALWSVFRTAERPHVRPAAQATRPLVAPRVEAPPLSPPAVGRVIPGGVLNGKAISKPAPAYPAVAKAARASGTVRVEIVVGQDGDVVSARALSGHPLLQEAAVNAVRQWKFAPTRLSGVPVKVSGVVTVNFVPE